MTLADALYVGYRHFRWEHPASLVTPERLRWQMRRDGCPASLRSVLAHLCHHPWLMLREGGVVTERPQYPGVGIPCYRFGGKIMWGGQRDD